MNMGYSTNKHNINVSCPVCGSDIYGNKYGTDFHCMNDKCFLNRGVTKAMKQCETIATWYCGLDNKGENSK
jgi:hypothetical protein